MNIGRRGRRLKEPAWAAIEKERYEGKVSSPGRQAERLSKNKMNDA